MGGWVVGVRGKGSRTFGPGGLRFLPAAPLVALPSETWEVVSICCSPSMIDLSLSASCAKTVAVSFSDLEC